MKKARFKYPWKHSLNKLITPLSRPLISPENRFIRVPNLIFSKTYSLALHIFESNLECSVELIESRLL